MMLKSLFFFVSLFFSSVLFAQGKPLVNPDRPDQTDAAYTIEKRYLQVENGLFLHHDEESKTYGIANILLRLGVIKNFELRLGGLLVNEKKKLVHANTGIQSAELGFKINVFKQKGILPATSFGSSSTLPFLFSAPFKTGLIQNTTKFLFSNDLSTTTQLGYNVGIITVKHEAPVWFYTISLSKGLNEKLGCFIEGYSFFQSATKPDFNFDGGFSYSLSDFFVMDIAAGFSASNSQTYFITAGISYLLPGKIF
jgi:hypothetical protein